MPNTMAITGAARYQPPAQGKSRGEADHAPACSIRFKEIRSKEETLAGLKKSRDSLGGRIEAQDRKVSKMKEENKDLPAQKQRLRDMQQEMVGLEHSVLTEETRWVDTSFHLASGRAGMLTVLCRPFQARRL